MGGTGGDSTTTRRDRHGRPLRGAAGRRRRRGRDAEPAPHVPESIGPFVIVRTLASGGMGTVYEARQEHPNRIVAVKVMRPDVLDYETLHRFRVEADLLARLTHPGIAQVYQAGTYEQSGVEMPYFALEFVHDARTLTDYAEFEQLDIRERLELFAKVCEAVEFGHQRGVIHRDLKPDNILIDDSSKPAQPKVIDFGVARATDSDVAAATLRTNVGQLVGTLRYMSPEQVEADPGEIDERSDVYALGVVLYELLTGRLPYDLDGAHFLEVMRIIREDQPTRLSTNARALRGDIETIAIKALEKEKSRRYQSAAELLGDVRAFLNGEPISARPPSTFYQIQSFARRNRAAFSALLAVFLVSIVAAIVSIRWAVRADSLADSERAARSKIERQLYRANLNNAVEGINGGRLDLVDELLASTPEDLRGWEWRHLASRVDESLDLPVPAAWRSPWLEYAPDGFSFFVRDASDPDHMQAVIVDARDGSELLRLPEVDSRCFFTPDQRQLIELDYNVGIQRWDLESGELVRALELHPRRDHFSFSMNAQLGRYSYHTADSIEVRDLYTDELLDTIPGWHFLSAYDSRGDVLMVTDFDALHFLDARTHEPLREPVRFAPQDVMALDPQPNDEYVAVGTSNGTVWLVAMDADSAEAPIELADLRLPITALAWSEEGDRLAAGSNGGKAAVYDIATGEPTTRLPLHDGWISDLTFVPRCGELICSDSEGNLRKWSTDLSSMNVLRDHVSYVYALDVAPDGVQFLTGGWDGYEKAAGGLKFRDARTSALVATYGTAEEIFMDAKYAADGEVVVASVWTIPGNRCEVRVIDSLTLETRLGFRGHNGSRVERLEVHPDETRVLSISTEGAALLWDSTSGEVLQRFEPSLPLSSFGMGVGTAFSPDGRLLALTRGQREIWLYDTASGERLRHWTAHEEPIWDLTFSPDGRTLYSASSDDSVGVWEAATGTLAASLIGHGQEVLSVEPSPDGTRVATGGRDANVRLWDTETFEEVVRLTGHDDYVFRLAWGPNGEWLASTSGDYTARVWDTAILLERETALHERDTLIRHIEAPVAKALRDAGDPHSALATLPHTGRAAEIARQLVQGHAARFRNPDRRSPWGPAVYTTARANGPIEIDGRLDEASWQDVSWTTDFVDIEGWRSPPPALATRARILWDDEFLYFGAELQEPHVWGELSTRDAIVYNDNDIELFLDPGRDGLWYYEFEVNALDTLLDLMLDRPYRRKGSARIDWDAAGVRHAVHVDGTLNDPSDVDEGWSVEFAIPWTAFQERSRVPLPPVPGSCWKMNVSRVQWQHEVVDGRYRKRPGTDESNWVWTPQHEIDMHVPERWGLLIFGR